MQIEYQPFLVILSIVIAMLSSGITLFLFDGINKINLKQRLIRIVYAAITFATGVWAMHFIGMLACKMPVPVAYDKWITFYSFLLALSGSIPAMLLLSQHYLNKKTLLTAAIILSLAVTGMHFTGMASLRMQPPIAYNPPLFLLSIIVAFIASYIGLSVMAIWKNSRIKPKHLLVFAGAVLGIAISSMHYIAMIAAEFSPDSISMAVGSDGLSGETLIYAVSSATLLVFLMSLFMALQDKAISVWKVLLIIVLSEATIMLLLPILLPPDTSLFVKTFLDGILLALFVSPIAWQMKKTSSELLNSHLTIERNLDIQQVHNRLLKVPFHQLEMQAFLNQLLQIIFSLSWLEVLPTGAFFLADKNSTNLKMVAQTNLDQNIKKSCQQVAFGQCLCGQAAKIKQTVYCTHVNSQHTTHFQGMKDHGHFILPLEAGDKLLGVLCLYLSPGQNLSSLEKNALQSIAVTVSDLIHLKQALDEVKLANTVFEYSFDGLMITDANFKILNVNPMFTKVTGYTATQVLGKTPNILQSSKQDPGLYQEIIGALKHTGQWQGEIWNRRKNGEDFQQWLSITTVKDNKGHVQYYVSTFMDITEKKAAEEKIHQLAFYDELTGLANRTLFYDRLKQALKHAKRSGDKVALLFIDLDRFKEINDSLGHQAGDEVLKDVAQRIRSCLRGFDTLARLGGDEFVVILEDLKDNAIISPKTVCQTITKKILNKLTQAHYIADQVFYSGASIGIVFYPDNAMEFHELLQRADTAMYQAKNAGRNTYRFYSDRMSEDIKSRVMMIHELKHALSKQELSLVYQPQININNQQLVGAEALLRWHNAELGQISPIQFIPLAEEVGLIYEIGLWVIEQVCQQIKVWSENNQLIFQYLALNVSIHQITRSTFVDDAIDICRRIGINTHQLEFEITEGGLAQYPDNITNLLHKLREAGFRLAIDDFGTDYSSLSRLKSFNVDLLKIDRSFVKDMTQNSDDEAIVKAIIEMADALGLMTLAEGVETLEQVESLKKMGCQRCQGYYFGKPMSPDDLIKLYHTSVVV
jgi:diguanylate cyclase (GGDEF)-like protein/PAS domain S-box-containing protein